MFIRRSFVLLPRGAILKGLLFGVPTLYSRGGLGLGNCTGGSLYGAPCTGGRCCTEGVTIAPCTGGGQVLHKGCHRGPLYMGGAGARVLYRGGGFTVWTILSHAPQSPYNLLQPYGVLTLNYSYCAKTNTNINPH